MVCLEQVCKYPIPYKSFPRWKRKARHDRWSNFIPGLPYIDTSLPALRVIRVLERLLQSRGKPAVIRVDNGPEFISDRLAQWSEANNVKLLFIQPGKPVQNAFIERNNGSLRKELLDAYLFFSLEEIRIMAEEWRQDYNCQRPHQSLGFVPPAAYI